MSIHGNGLSTTDNVGEAARKVAILRRRAAVELELNGKVSPKVAIELTFAEEVWAASVEAHEAATDAANDLQWTD